MNVNEKNNWVRDKGRPIYLDYQATTPIDSRVVEAMAPFFAEKFGNPHSSSHFFGWEAEEAVERARGQIATLIGAEAGEIIFTSGATEANNLAIKGIARFHQKEKNHLVTCATEHKCVLDSCAALEDEGFKVTYLPVQADGLIDLEQLKHAITPQTALVSIMAVNNEIGVIQPIADIGAICRARDVFFHTDAAQAAGRIALDVEDAAIDLMSLSGHKVYAPMGIGALYVRRCPRVRLEPLFSGGTQEHGLRPGTLPAPLCVGMGVACDIAAQEMADEGARLMSFKTRFINTIASRIPGAVLNGDRDKRVPGNLNLSFPGVQAEDLMAALKDLAISNGSACTSGSSEPSHVLGALGLDDEMVLASIRIGFGRFTTEEEIDYAAEKIAAEVDRLGHINPRQSAAPAQASA